MEKIIFTKEQVYELVTENRYEVDPEKKFQSRCIDGRYENSSDLPALAIPGADAGEIGIVAAAGQTYGFTVDLQKTADTIVETVGGIQQFNFHTDSHADPSVPAGGCGHIRLITSEFERYRTTKEFAAFLNRYLQQAKKNGAHETRLQEDHGESAVLVITGSHSVQTQCRMQTEGGVKNVQVFVFHSSLVNERHKALVEKLIKNRAVEIIEGCDADYLYTVLSEITDIHLFETMKHLAKGLPIYGINFQDDGDFEMVDLGNVK